MNFTRTKIICTIGPATQDIGSLRRLHKSGMNVARINMSHATHKSAKAVIDKIHKINNDSKFNYGKIGILLDTQGPEIRTGDTELTMDLKVGDEVTLTVRDQVDVETSSIKINYKDLIKSVSEGSKISVDNGLINFKVLSKDEETLLCKVLDGGKLGSKRHVNLPGVRVNLPSITSKDLDDIEFGMKNNVDFIALSFVRDSEDLEKLQKILDSKKSKAKIIAKIENQEGLDNIHQISKASWGVMVARGDLGIETSLTDLPNIQRRIMHACAKWGRRSIVASDWQHIGLAAKNLAESIKADGIIAITRTGKTAQYISNSKPNGIPIFTFTGNKKTLSQLTLVGSTESFYLANLSNHEKTLENVSKILKKYYGRDGMKFIMVSSIFSEEHSEAIQIINI